MRNENEIVKTYKAIKEDYAYDGGIFCNDDEKVRRLKEIIDTRLSVVDKTIFLLYTDAGSLRKVGEIMGFSHSTMATEVKRIRGIILKEFNKNENNN